METLERTENLNMEPSLLAMACTELARVPVVDMSQALYTDSGLAMLPGGNKWHFHST
jgi:hypothetical protein